MIDTEIGTGVVHEVPDDLRATLISNADLVKMWNDLTPLARNEWICWVTIVKKAETRKEHIDRLAAEILEGKRRPCYDARIAIPKPKSGLNSSRY